jgi:hypothetical protein
MKIKWSRIYILAGLSVFTFMSVGFGGWFATFPDWDASPVSRVRLIIYAAALGLFALGCFVFAVAVCRIIFSTLVMAINTNDHLSDAPALVRWNTANTLFAPEYLNEKGLAARGNVMSAIKSAARGFGCCIPYVVLALYRF